MTELLRGKAIIEKCREQIAAVFGIAVTMGMISEAIYAQTGKRYSCGYLHKLHNENSKLTAANRAVFAQFLTIDAEALALYALSGQSQARIRQLESEHKRQWFNRKAVEFITRPTPAMLERRQQS